MPTSSVGDHSGREEACLRITGENHEELLVVAGDAWGTWAVRAGERLSLTWPRPRSRQLDRHHSNTSGAGVGAPSCAGAQVMFKISGQGLSSPKAMVFGDFSWP